MSIIKKFESFFDDKNVNKYHWFDNEYQYLINMDFIFSGDEGKKVGDFTKGNVKIEKKAHFQYGEQYYYLLTVGDKQKRFETFSELKKSHFVSAE
jgi:hypothetical protein